MKAATLTAAVAVTLLWQGQAHATLSNKELEARTDDMLSRLAAIERANQTLVQMQQQIEAGKKELRSLRGEIDEAKHELETLKQQQRDLYSDVDRRLLLIENGAQPTPLGTTQPLGTPTPAGTARPAPSEAEIRSVDEASVYGDSFAALKASRYDEAVRGFQLYLTKYPDGPRADNATYWLGEAYYVQKQYDAALRSFQDVLGRFPDSRKAPDALLKSAYCQYELKAYDNARSTLESVVKTYPGTESARLAEQRLTKLEAEGR
jgi:tol-pal system protein YbgF